MDGWTNALMDGQVDARKDERKEGRMDGLVGGRPEGKQDTWTGRCHARPDKTEL